MNRRRIAAAFGYLFLLILVASAVNALAQVLAGWGIRLDAFEWQLVLLAWIGALSFLLLVPVALLSRRALEALLKPPEPRGQESARVAAAMDRAFAPSENPGGEKDATKGRARFGFRPRRDPRPRDGPATPVERRRRPAEGQPRDPHRVPGGRGRQAARGKAPAGGPDPVRRDGDELDRTFDGLLRRCPKCGTPTDARLFEKGELCGTCGAVLDIDSYLEGALS